MSPETPYTPLDTHYSWAGWGSSQAEVHRHTPLSLSSLSQPSPQQEVHWLLQLNLSANRNRSSVSKSNLNPIKQNNDGSILCLPKGGRLKPTHPNNLCFQSSREQVTPGTETQGQSLVPRPPFHRAHPLTRITLKLKFTNFRNCLSWLIPVVPAFRKL